MELWVASIILLLVGLGIVVVELFVPSGGLLAVLSGLTLLSAVVVAFLSSPTMGIVILTAIALLLPTMFGVGVRVWPHTAFGRRMLAPPPATEEEILPDLEIRRHLQSLIGKRGRALSKMLPSGDVRIDGRVYDAMSDGMPVEPGELVEVTAVKMNRIEVRRVERESPPSDPTDPLARPLEAFGLDPLDARLDRPPANGGDRA